MVSFILSFKDELWTTLDIKMEIKYKRQHNESFMIIEGEVTASNFEEKMIEKNKISSLLEISKLQLNGLMQYNYGISRKENLEDFLESHELSKDLLRRIIFSIHMAYEEIGRYLIDEHHIYLSTETVFLEKSNGNYRVSLCYYPKDMGSVQQQFRGIMEYMLKVVPVTDKEFTKLVYRIYDITLKGDYTLEELLEAIEPEECSEEVQVQQIDLREDTDFSDFASQGEAIAEEVDYYQRDMFAGEFISDLQEDTGEEKPGILNQLYLAVKSIIPGKLEFKDSNVEDSEDFIIEPDMEFEDKTVLLSETKPTGKLIYDGLNQEEDFLVNKDVFKIGKAKTNDAILHSPTVSGNHAKITRQGSEYYITDLNSTNATFVNDKELIYRKPVKLNICDKIRFANVSYVFM